LTKTISYRYTNRWAKVLPKLIYWIIITTVQRLAC